MELAGLKRGMQWLKTNNVNLTTLITDRHAQVRAWIKKETYTAVLQRSCKVYPNEEYPSFGA